MKHPGMRTSLALSILILVLITVYGCSEDIGSYRDLEESGRVEETVRKRYSALFRGLESMIKAVESDRTVSIDSTLITSTASATDKVVEDLLPFPTTLDSRIAFDALTYAATDLIASSSIRHRELMNFWQSGLLAPLFSTGQKFVDEGGLNESAHMQILKGIQRATGEMVSDDMLIDCISLVGVTPSEQVMAFCDTDTLMLKKIHDLILYARSLQETDPPLWLLSGNWLFTMKFGSGQPPIFLALKPHMADEVAYLSFRDIPMSEVYAALYDDPIPNNLEAWNSWYVRATAVMNNLVVDDDFVRRVQKSTLPTENAHYLYNNYLIRSDADSVHKEIVISFVRRRVQENDFEHIGSDSIAVRFNQQQILYADGIVTEAAATREIGSSLVGGQLYPTENLVGSAFLIAIGEHDAEIAEAYRQRLREMVGPEITVSTEPPAGPANTPSVGTPLE